MFSKFTTLVFTLLFVSVSFAADINFSINPASPTIVHSNLVLNPGQDNERTILGPWFLGNFTVENNSFSEISIAAMTFEVKSAEGQSEEYTISFDPIMVIDRNETASTQEFLESLPESASNVYTVKVKLHGWTGGPNTPKDRLNNTLNFVTQ